jgi:hypothetical protein
LPLGGHKGRPYKVIAGRTREAGNVLSKLSRIEVDVLAECLDNSCKYHEYEFMFILKEAST